MKREQLRNSGMLLLAAVIWGVAFVAQSVGMDYVGPFTFNAVRSILGSLVLIPCIFFLDKINGKKEFSLLPKDREERKLLLTGGIWCGLFLCAASNMQQIGIMHTTVGKAGFITSCYIVLVPLMGIFFKKKIRASIWISVNLALMGLYFLCMTDSFHFSRGDLYVLICAFLFAGHILVIDYFADKVDGVRMSCIQFLVSGLISSVLMFCFESPSFENVWEAKLPILYAGVLSCGVAYTLQIVGQKNMNPTVASLILSLESCISVLAGWAILSQKLSGRELTGCAVMFGAIILAQLPEKKRDKITETTQI